MTGTIVDGLVKSFSRFKIEELTVYFPYTHIYPEQYKYMFSLKQGLDAKGPVCLEMPTGTGKTVSLLSLITSHQVVQEREEKLIYCCRTVGEVEKTIEELKEVIRYRDQEMGEFAPKTLALSLSSRKNMCIHGEVSKLGTREEVDVACRSLTAPWVREKVAQGNDMIQCSYYEGYFNETQDFNLSGILSLEDLMRLGAERNICPYFISRKALLKADIVVFSYQYMLNPRIAEMVSKQFGENSIVVFDEAHNIDDVCIEALSINLNKKRLEQSTRNVIRLNRDVEVLKTADAARLQEEFQRLLNGVRNNDEDDREIGVAGPVLPQHIVDQAVPEEIRVADEFVQNLSKFVEFVRGRLQLRQVYECSPAFFLKSVRLATAIEYTTLQFYSERLNSLLKTLEITDLHAFTPLSAVCDFATLVSTYTDGFKIIIEPYDDRTPTISDPLLQFVCLDAALAMQPVIKKYGRVVITSGTLTPLNMLPRIMGFVPVVSQSFTTTLCRQSVLPVIVCRGSDQTFLSTKYQDRENMDIVRNYGLLLLRLCETVPDGIVVFFTSYWYLQNTLSVWNAMGLVNKLLHHKLLFVETSDFNETAKALMSYKMACDCGRGAVFLSVARGKVSEGIDFADHYGRCVVLFGIPYIYTESRVLRARLEYLRDNYQIRDGDFLTFDAMRTAAQCVGRVIRGKGDYGIMVFADKRYDRLDKRSKLPQWIIQYLGSGQMSLSTDGAVSLASTFLRKMSQPVLQDEQLGTSLWTKEHLLEYQNHHQNQRRYRDNPP